jgi:predicted glycosyltransferase involved in capsule biosynthesis
MDKHKLGVIVPYRNRLSQLAKFKRHMPYYFNKNKIDYNIFIVEQDGAKQFNRGILLNIGFNYALKHNCDYVVFHDIDMLPKDVDYSYSDKPLHLSTNFEYEDSEKERDIFEEYFGGVTMFPVEDFKKINGYSNKYWAWGYEDDDLLLRCKENNIELDTLNIKNFGRNGKSLRFNGKDALVKCKNIINLNSNATFFISFYPDKLHLDHTRETDEFTVFSIPGWDFAICYNS